MTPTPLPPRVVTRAVAYPPDAGRLLEHLARTGLVGTVGVPGRTRPVDTVLLESVDTATKASRTTIAVLQASTRLTCEGDAVTVEVLPPSLIHTRRRRR